MKTQPQAISHNGTVVVLVGGLGTRLRLVVSDRPKVLADVGGRPFLDRLLENVKPDSERVVLSVGYLGEQIKARYADPKIFFAEETTPLGTGGGLKNAEKFIQGNPVLVMNGDSWFSKPVDLTAFRNFHASKNALVTMLLTRPRTEKDYGAVLLAKNSEVTGFTEKDQNAPGEHFMSAGVYLMDRKAFDHMPSEPFSLEKDFFPKLIGSAFYGFLIDGEVIDIGTPERYETANKVFFT